jgi:hypothetical protein
MAIGWDAMPGQDDALGVARHRSPLDLRHERMQKAGAPGTVNTHRYDRPTAPVC